MLVLQFSPMELAIRCLSHQTFVKVVWPILMLGFLGFWIFLQNDVPRSSVQFFKPEYFSAETIAPLLLSKYYLINTEGCRIQMMDAFDSSILKYLLDKDSAIKDPEEKPIVCSPQGLPPLVSSNFTHIFTDESSIAMRNLTHVNCCYQPFWRKPVQNISTKVGQIDNEYVTDDECISFSSTANMGDNEFVKVQCTNEDSKEIIYKDFFSFTPIKHNKTLNMRTNKRKVSILMLGVDAVSRLNFIRKMPNTLNFMKTRLKAIEMLGYNKVGDNTFPNLVPVLAGLSIKELENSCWPNKDSYFDDCAFLWNNYSDAGYTTCFAEDSSWMGIFNYLKIGFFNQPTDYYYGMYNRRVESEIGSSRRINADLCSGNRLSLEILLEYGKRFVMTMSKQLFFSFIWGSSISHDSLNLPMYGDDLHKNFLSELNTNGIFDNSVLILMSDHGIRWGGIRNTYQGYMEERLPFLYFVFPRWFKRKYSAAIGNLRMNTRKLTTPFDLHETILDLLNLDNLQENSIKKRVETGETTRRGISLFLPVPSNRTCKLAGIPSNWCTCHKISEVSVNISLVAKAADILVTHINSLLAHEGQCAHLILKRILSARVAQVIPENEHGKLEKISWARDYIITIETEPGDALFEATVRYNTDKTFKTMGTVSRINTYGNQSVCISNYKLRLYCFCISQISTVSPWSHRFHIKPTT